MRFLAVLLDMIFLIPVYLLLIGVVLLATGGESLTPEAELSPGLLLFELLIVAGAAVLYATFESSAMQGTPGKRVLGLAVTDLHGNRISFARGIGRFFGRYLSSIILLFGYLIVAFTPRKQALHDMICGTLVIRR
jgi:uncharacterized RDD family membrane protein YckC